MFFSHKLSAYNLEAVACIYRPCNILSQKSFSYLCANLRHNQWMQNPSFKTLN